MANQVDITGEISEQRSGWLSSLALTRADNAFDTELQGAKVRRAATLWPIAFYAQLVALTLALAPLLLSHAYDRLAMSSIPAGMIAAISIAVSMLFSASAFRRMRPDRQVKFLLPATAMLGASVAWLGWLVGTAPAAGFEAIGIVAVAAAAAITVICLLSAPALMLGFAAAAILAGSIVLANPAIAIIGIATLACLWAVALVLARYDRQIADKLQREDSDSRRATRLIAEFEANGQGWFWETDRAGKLVYLSDKLAGLFERKPGDLRGEPFAALIQSEGSVQDGERTLGYHLSARSAFRDVNVRAAVEGDDRWWSISGRPIVDSIGQFRGFSGTGADLTDKRRSDEEAARLARYDELTGLANRQQMRLALDNALHAVRGKDHKPVSLFLLDLDRFKTVNDTMGHPVGDELLKQVAQRLFRSVGDRGMVGRLGGDEFQIVFPEFANRDVLGERAREIIAALSRPYQVDGVTLTIGCSIGIVTAPEDGSDSDALVRNSDLALYAAKDDGRGVFRFYEDHMHTGAKKRKRLEDDLRHALDKGELHLTYQPVVSTADAHIVGYEALIRWNHPSHGAISPTDFIPVAEDIRLIEQIGEWVLRTACHAAAQWPANVRVAVNVSPIQFANPSLPATVASALSRSGLAPDRLELEITEGVFLDEGADTDRMFKALKGLGVRLALDDFGTGYSSLGYLKSAPFDKIKIDQSFIRGAAVPGNRNAALVKAIVSLAETLYMETTAEGVEIEDEIELVRDLGCSHIQGYIYGKPMLDQEVHRQLADSEGKATASGYKASRSPRSRMLRSAMVDIGGDAHKVRIRDISATGAMIEGLQGAEADSDILIEILENQMFPAKVKWSDRDRVGIEFARGFDLERLADSPHVEVRAAPAKALGG